MTTHVEAPQVSPRGVESYHVGPASYCWTDPVPVPEVPCATLSRGWWQLPDGRMVAHGVTITLADELTIGEAHALGRALLALENTSLLDESPPRLRGRANC